MSESKDTGDISDGYHTFNELYHHRIILFSIICAMHPEKAWKSLLHSDGIMFENYFIVGITTPQGNYSYHCHKDHWDRFAGQVLEHAPEWDGHLPKDIDRLLSLL